MNKTITIWMLGNNGMRNPNRIMEGFKVFAASPFVGKLHGPEYEIGFTKKELSITKKARMNQVVMQENGD